MVQNNSLPLVSIVVVTYNSSSTILETLDSIKAQTYRNIELIVSDDHSTDNTREIVSVWVGVNKDRFVHSELVTTDKNTGVAGNLNRGVEQTHGEWIKIFAADDLLISTAVEEFVNFVQCDSQIRICISDLKLYTDEGVVSDKTREIYNNHFRCAQETYEQQLNRIKYEMRFAGPGILFQRSLYDEVGGFQVKYPYDEEWPFFYNVLKKGVRIYPIEKKLIKYRISSDSACRKKENNGLSSRRVFFSNYDFFFDYPFHDLINDRRYLLAWHMYLCYHALKFKYDSNNTLLSKVWGRIYLLFSPWAYLKALRIVGRY